MYIALNMYKHTKEVVISMLSSNWGREGRKLFIFYCKLINWKRLYFVYCSIPSAYNNA